MCSQFERCAGPCPTMPKSKQCVNRLLAVSRRHVAATQRVNQSNPGRASLTNMLCPEATGTTFYVLFVCWPLLRAVLTPYPPPSPSFRPWYSWANLRALQRLVAKEEMVLDVNVRERQVNGMKTLQLETLGASAFQCFDKVTIVAWCLPCFFWTHLTWLLDHAHASTARRRHGEEYSLNFP